MRYSVARAVGFAENVGVAVIGAWFPAVTQASEHGGGAFALVGPFAERVMHAIGDGDRLRDARRNGAYHGVTCHGWQCFALPRTRLGGRGKGIFRADVIHVERTGREVPAGGLEFAGVGVERSEKVVRDF